MASRVLVSGLPRSLPPLPTGPDPSASLMSRGGCGLPLTPLSFPRRGPLQTLHMDVWGPARIRGQGHERYFLLVVDDYSRYTIVFPSAARVMSLRSTFHPRVSMPETSPAEPVDVEGWRASAFRVWGSRTFVRDLSADKLSPCAAPCVFLGFPPDAPGWQFYHPSSCRVLSSQDLTFDESAPTTASSPTALHPFPCHRSSFDSVCCWGAELGVLGLGVLRLGVLSLGVLSLGVLSLEVLRLGVAEPGGAEPGVMSLEVLHLEVLNLGVPRLDLLSVGVRSVQPGLASFGVSRPATGGAGAAGGTAAGGVVVAGAVPTVSGVACGLARTSFRSFSRFLVFLLLRVSTACPVPVTVTAPSPLPAPSPYTGPT
ncbi:unnamed protein product [Closterium sp. NIES-64]|nr:unnamed protein product [Closterium sp. NIES-64]